MKKTNTNLMLCAMVFAVALVISNVVTAKTVQTGFSLFGSGVLVPSAVICISLQSLHAISPIIAMPFQLRYWRLTDFLLNPCFR